MDFTNIKLKKIDQKRNKDVRKQNKIERLKNADKSNLLKKIVLLEEKGKILSRSENDRLKQLKSDIEFMEQNSIGVEKSEDTNNESLGKNSIFYDEDWNPDGIAPKGFKNIPYNSSSFMRRNPVIPHLAGLNNIKMP